MKIKYLYKLLNFIIILLWKIIDDGDYKKEIKYVNNVEYLFN